MLSSMPSMLCSQQLKEMSIKTVLFLRTINITEVFITTWVKNPNPFSFSLTIKFAVWVVISVKCLNSFFLWIEIWHNFNFFHQDTLVTNNVVAPLRDPTALQFSAASVPLLNLANSA